MARRRDRYDVEDEQLDEARRRGDEVVADIRERRRRILAKPTPPQGKSK
jgi:hypothetical protein